MNLHVGKEHQEHGLTADLEVLQWHKHGRRHTSAAYHHGSSDFWAVVHTSAHTPTGDGLYDHKTHLTIKAATHASQDQTERELPATSLTPRVYMQQTISARAMAGAVMLKLPPIIQPGGAYASPCQLPALTCWWLVHAGNTARRESLSL